MSETRIQFEKDLAEVDWKSLRIHLQRDALIMVSAQLDLVDAACKVVADDSAVVESWIEEGQLGKPSSEQLKAWETQLDKPFKMLIAAPYILIQELLHA